jgi:hypothetical protein
MRILTRTPIAMGFQSASKPRRAPVVTFGLPYCASKEVIGTSQPKAPLASLYEIRGAA